MNNEILMEVKSVSKSFPGVLALNNVSFHINKGEILALLGENGAGKSTLIKIISGVYQPDKGSIIFENESFREYSISNSKRKGIETMYQEPTLAPDLTVAENIFLDNLPVNKYGFIDYRKLFHDAEKIINEMGITINVRLKVQQLSLANIQLITLARCLIKNSKLIIMDEPSSSLSYEEQNILFRIIQYLKTKKIAIIYITHNINDAFKIADRTVVLRDGEVVKTARIVDTNEKEVISFMIGKQINRHKAEDNYSKVIDKNNIILEVRELYSKKYNLSNVSFHLNKGEVLGFYGLVGSGRTELFQLIIGLNKPDEGVIKVSGKEAVINNPSKAKALKVGMVPEDRLKWGIFGNLTVRENISISFLDKLSKLRFLDLGKEKRHVFEIIDRLKIKTPSPEQKIMHLSGGNKQKCLIGRWLLRDLDILIMDEPTRGIDIGAKSEIYEILRSLSQKGISIVIISSDIEEIIGMCDRAYVIHKGIISKSFENDEINKETLVKAALGV